MALNLLTEAEVNNLIHRSIENKKSYEIGILREKLRADLLYYMYYIKGSLNLEQLDAINSWVDHSNLGAREILKKLGEI